MMVVNGVLIFLFALAAIGCETVPSVQKVQAVKAQNQITQKHIASARQHIKKSETAQKEQSDHLQAASDDLDQLLRSESSPAPAPKKKRK